MSQNLRVALWVPMVDPGAVGNVIRTLSPSDVLTKKISSEFAEAGTGSGGPGGGGDMVFADNAEVAAGVVADEAISPATLRTELMRELDMPMDFFTAPIAIWEWHGLGMYHLVKTDDSGGINHTLITLDGGIF